MKRAKQHKHPARTTVRHHDVTCPRPASGGPATLAVPNHDPAPAREGYRQVEIAVEPVAPPTWPSISVCLIVKNEAENLRPCLESLGDLASEVIVVDTGSTDDTVRVAQELGARVHHFAWTNDFAAARNESLRHATAEWIFWLDADDRLSPDAVAQLKRAAASGRADAYMCLVTSIEADGKRTTAEHIRLFRNGLGIRFHGGIHETVGPDLVRLGLTLAATDIQVLHTGYECAETVLRKSERNLPIIEKEVARHPDRVDLLFYRGHALINLGRLDEGLSDMRAYLARSARQWPFSYGRFLAYAAAAGILDLRDQRDALEELLRDALQEFPGHPHFLLLLARLVLLRGRADEALAMLNEARGAMERPVRGLRPRDAWVELAIAEAYRAKGDKETALRWGQMAWEHAPDWELGGSFLARLYLDSGMAEEAEALLAELCSAAKTPDPWLVLSEMRFWQGRLKEAADAIEEARGRGLPADQADKRLARVRSAAALAATRQNGAAAKPGLVALQMRGMELLGKREYLAAAECFAEAVQESPTDPDSYRYLAACLKALGREAEAFEAWKLANHWESQATATSAAG